MQTSIEQRGWARQASGERNGRFHGRRRWSAKREEKKIPSLLYLLQFVWLTNLHDLSLSATSLSERTYAIRDMSVLIPVKSVGHVTTMIRWSPPLARNKHRIPHHGGSSTATQIDSPDKPSSPYVGQTPSPSPYDV
jgi:hypothetical protein